MTIRRALLVTFLSMVGSPLLAADDTHISSLPSDPLTSAETKRLFPMGSTGAIVQKAVPVWLLLDGTGLSADAVARLDAATRTTLVDALPADHSQLAHLVVGVSQHSAGGWRKAVDGTPHWAIHVAVDEALYRKLKGHARVGAQKTRLKIVGTWSQFRAKTYCVGVLGADACAVGKPAPFVLLGVSP